MESNAEFGEFDLWWEVKDSKERSVITNDSEKNGPIAGLEDNLAGPFKLFHSLQSVGAWGGNRTRTVLSTKGF